jgi:hypothetical protein
MTDRLRRPAVFRPGLLVQEPGGPLLSFGGLLRRETCWLTADWV